MLKLSERMATLGWTDIGSLLLEELVKQVEAQADRLDVLEKQHESQRLDILEAKPKQPLVDRRLVEEALDALRDFRHTFVEGSWNYEQLWRIHILLRRALEGDSDDHE